jgi:hypothetical protein
MVKKVPDIGTHTAQCVEAGTPGQAATRRHLQVGAMPVRGNQGVATERAGARGKTHAGWFHRSSPGKVRWIPADGDQRTRPPEPTRNQRKLMAAAASRPFPVDEVKGRRPAGLDDFLGVTSFTVLSGDLPVLVFGTGEQCADGVRFRQQDLGRDGKEIRTWLITTAPDGIVAAPGTSV